MELFSSHQDLLIEDTFLQIYVYIDYMSPFHFEMALLRYSKIFQWGHRITLHSQINKILKVK